MNIKKLLSVLGIIGTVCSLNSAKAETRVLIFGKEGSPLVMENGVANRPENAFGRARIFLAQELRRLWAGVEPFPEQFIRDIARSTEGARARLITASDIGVRNYPGVNQRVYDRIRRVAIPGYRPPVPAKSDAYHAHKARRAAQRESMHRAQREEAATKIQSTYRGFADRKRARAMHAERNARGARAASPRRERGFLAKLFGGDKGYEIDEQALADDATEREFRRAELEMARDRASRAADDYDRFALESARGDARKAMKDYDLFGPGRGEAYFMAKQEWMAKHSQSKGWHDRMLRDLKKRFPREVAIERKHKK